LKVCLPRACTSSPGASYGLLEALLWTFEGAQGLRRPFRAAIHRGKVPPRSGALLAS
jgi:hypothetical protein